MRMASAGERAGVAEPAAQQREMVSDGGMSRLRLWLELPLAPSRIRSLA